MFRNLDSSDEARCDRRHMVAKWRFCSTKGGVCDGFAILNKLMFDPFDGVLSNMARTRLFGGWQGVVRTDQAHGTDAQASTHPKSIGTSEHSTTRCPQIHEPLRVTREDVVSTTASRAVVKTTVATVERSAAPLVVTIPVFPFREQIILAAVRRLLLKDMGLRLRDFA